MDDNDVVGTSNGDDLVVVVLLEEDSDGMGFRSRGDFIYRSRHIPKGKVFAVWGGGEAGKCGREMCGAP